MCFILWVSGCSNTKREHTDEVDISAEQDLKKCREIIDKYNQMNQTRCICFTMIDDVEQEDYKVIDVDKKNELVQIEYRDDPWWDCVIYKMLEEWEKTTFVTNGKEARLCLYNKKDENEEWDIAYTTDDIANKLVMNDIEIRTWESMEIVSKDEENNIVELQIVGKIENNHAETIGSYLEQGMLDNEDLLNIPESRKAYEQCLNENKFEMHLWIDLDREVPIKSEVDVTLIWQLDYYAFPVVGEDLPEKVMYVVIYEPNEFEDIVLPVLP